MCEIIKKKKSVLFLHLRFGFWQIKVLLCRFIFSFFFPVDSTDQINIFTANHEPPVLMFGVTEASF